MKTGPAQPSGSSNLQATGNALEVGDSGTKEESGPRRWSLGQYSFGLSLRVRLGVSAGSRNGETGAIALALRLQPLLT